MGDISVAELALRLVVSLAVVVALMLIAAKLLRRVGGGLPSLTGGKATVTPIDIAAVRPLTRNASVAVVRVAGRELVLGVTEQEVSLLHSGIEPRELDLAPTAAGSDVSDDAGGDGETATTPSFLSSLPITARIAVGGADRARRHRERQPQAGLPAWTDALESLRERTVRR